MAGRGGETEFASSRAAFEAFPMKAEVEDLICVPVILSLEHTVDGSEIR